MFQIPGRHSSRMTFENLISAAFMNAVLETVCKKEKKKMFLCLSMHNHSWEWLSGFVFGERKCRWWIFSQAYFWFLPRALKKIEVLSLPFECSDLRWSTVSWRISAFSSFADPCFSNADGTSRLSSVRDVLILSRRFFSMTPRRFLRLMSWQLSFSMDDGLEKEKEKKITN